MDSGVNAAVRMLLDFILFLKKKKVSMAVYAAPFPIIYLRVFVSSSSCLLFVFSLLLSMTGLPPSSHQNSRLAEEDLINLCVLPLKLNIGN